MLDGEKIVGEERLLGDLGDLSALSRSLRALDNHFEKLTKEYLRVRAQDARRNSLLHRGTRPRHRAQHRDLKATRFSRIYRLDYSVTLDLAFIAAVRNTVNWGMEKGYKSFHSSGLDYDPEYGLRHS